MELLYPLREPRFNCTSAVALYFWHSAARFLGLGFGAGFGFGFGFELPMVKRPGLGAGPVFLGGDFTAGFGAALVVVVGLAGTLILAGSHAAFIFCAAEAYAGKYGLFSAFLDCLTSICSL